MTQQMPPPYPVSVRGRLDEPLNLWLVLVKWLLLLPHYLLLSVLSIASIVATLFALIAILATGKYPRVLFDFNAGVLRWTWRESFYGYLALGTDAYPPFTLGEAPDYPATLTIAYPERMHRGLLLVKWVLAVPHLLIVSLLGAGYGIRGVTGMLVMLAIVMRLINKRYPEDLFKLIVGMNRWVLRVSAYMLLMTDRYPPFRLEE